MNNTLHSRTKSLKNLVLVMMVSANELILALCRAFKSFPFGNSRQIKEETSNELFFADNSIRSGNDVHVKMEYSTILFLQSWIIQNMPPAPRISKDKAVSILIEKYQTIVTSKDLPIHTDPIWKELAAEDGGKWTSHNWYNKLKKDDGDGILSLARKKLNNMASPNVTLNETINSSMDDSKVEFEIYEREKKEGESSFSTYLSKEEWEILKPLTMDNMNEILECKLQPGPWCDVIENAFYKQNRLPCIFSFDGAIINTRDRKFLKIQGHCKSPKCKNEFYGYCDEKPRTNNTELLINVRARDTRGLEHEKMQSQWNTDRKRKLQEEDVTNEGKKIRKNEEKLSKEKRKRTSAPKNPNGEIIDKSSITGNPIKTIYYMQFQQPYLGCIQDVIFDPCQVYYGSSADKFIYKTYSTSTRSSSISIGAIDKFIKPLVRPNGLPSLEISQLSIAIKFDDKILPLFHAILSEMCTKNVKQFIRRWLRRMNSRPKQVTIPYEEVMISACSKGFNNLTIERYIDRTLQSIECNKDLPRTLTILRIEFPNLLNIILHYSCLKNIESRGVRDFYLKCFALVAKSKNMEEFKKLFTQTCTVALQNYKNSIISRSSSATVDDVRKELQSTFPKLDNSFSEDLKRIESQLNGKTSVPINHTLPGSSSKTEQFLHELVNKLRQIDEIPESDLQFSDPESSRSEKFIMELIVSTFSVAQMGNELNAYYLPGMVIHLYLLGRRFPMWTAIAMPQSLLQSSQNHAQKYLDSVKTSLSKSSMDSLDVDEFLKYHMEFLEKEIKHLPKLDASDTKQGFDEKSQDETEDKANESARETAETTSKSKEEARCEFEAAAEEINENESAINSKKKVDIDEKLFYDHFKPKTSQSTYFKANPEGKIAYQLKSKSSHVLFLRNGHLVSESSVSGKRHRVSNTCGFDSICRILLMSALADPSFYEFVSSSNNLMMKLIVDIIENKKKEDIWEKRLQILFPHYKGTLKCIRTDKRDILSVFDAKDSLLNIIHNVMASEPSASTVLTCSKCNSRILGNLSAFSPNHRTIEKSGFGNLQAALEFYPTLLKVYCSKCKEKSGTKTIQPNTYIFIDLDIRQAQNKNVTIKGRLRDFPVEIQVGQQYRLAGIIDYDPQGEHFTSYSRKLSGLWEYYNDMGPKPESRSENTQVLPHGAMYVLNQT